MPRFDALLTLPRVLRVQDVRGNQRRAVERDEMDVVYVTKYRIRKAAP